MGTLNVRNIPEELHHAAKVSAVKEGRSLREWLIEAIKEKLEKEKR